MSDLRYFLLHNGHVRLLQAIGVLSIVYATYEMHKAANFYDHQIAPAIDDVVWATENRTTARPPLTSSVKCACCG